MTLDETRPIALIGLMGAGKSTVARILGERLGVSVADLDSMIEAEEGHPIAELFEREGEAWFRRRERDLLERVLAGPVRVLACGGGVVLDPASREHLRRVCRVVWLRVPPEVAAARLAGPGPGPGFAGGHGRPLLGSGPPGERLTDLLAARGTLYDATAHLRVDTAGRDAEAVADAVLSALPTVAGPEAELRP